MMRKRILSLALALVMCLGLSVPAMAKVPETWDEIPAYFSANVSLKRQGEQGLLDDSVWLADDTLKCSHEALSSNQCAYSIISMDTAWTVTNNCVDGLGLDVTVKKWKVFDSYYGYSEYAYTYWTDGELKAWSNGDGAIPVGQSASFSVADIANGLNKSSVYNDGLQEGDVIEISCSLMHDGSGYGEHVAAHLFKIDSAAAANILAQNPASGTPSAPEPEPAPAPAPEPEAAPVFTDVSSASPYAEAINWAVSSGITKGTTDTTFSPDQGCTNGQILTFLWRRNGSPEPAIANPFTDSIPEAYAKAAVWAYEKGMVSGTTFDAAKPCTRAMTVQYLWIDNGRPEYELDGTEGDVPYITSPLASKFTDVPASAPYRAAVAWAIDWGVTNGTSETAFSPDKTCTRGQIVTFIYRNTQ